MSVSRKISTAPAVRQFGLTDYASVWRRMTDFVNEAGPGTREEIWLLSHHPVFTLGQAGKREHLLAPGDIPVVESDRGGQVTYHGPGQLVAYPLLNLRRRGLGVRKLVDLLESALIDTLTNWNIKAETRPGAPGVYVDDAKIAALGLRLRRGWSCHGISLNVDMDLAPFARINPCGYQGLEVTRIADFTGKQAGLMSAVTNAFRNSLLQRLKLDTNSTASPPARNEALSCVNSAQR